MAEKLAGTPAQKQPTETLVDDPEDEGPRPGSRPTKGHADAFGAAFDAAEAELNPAKAKPKAKAALKADEEAEEHDEPAPRKPVKAKAIEAEDDDAAADKKGQEADKKPVKKAAKAAGTDNDDEAGDDDEGATDSGKKKAAKSTDSDEAEADAEAEKAKPKGPLTAKNYWPRERREAFPYQSRDVQEAWLGESPAPHAHWATDQKETFARQPREVQEAWLEHTQAVERGFGQKFEALAGERKLAESIRGVITPEIRTQMQQFGLKSEADVLSGLLHLQQQSVKDPIGYVRNFIVRNKLDPAHFIPDEEGRWPSNGQNGASPVQADIESHPVVQRLQAELTSLKTKLEQGDVRREEDEAAQIDNELGTIVAERDEHGEPRFPFIRLLADHMAQILERNPARYGAMGRLEGLAEAYEIALKAHPELPQQKRTATTKKSKPAPVEEQADEDDDFDEADSEDDAATVKLKQAATKKSKTPLSAPGSSGDPFTRAFSRAEKQLGTR